jgi:hypothetical protein
VGGGWASQRREQIYGPSLPIGKRGVWPKARPWAWRCTLRGCRPPPSGPSLGVPLAGKGAIIRTWMFQKLLKLLGHIKRFISTSGHFYTVSEKRLANWHFTPRKMAKYGLKFSITFLKKNTKVTSQGCQTNI